MGCLFHIFVCFFIVKISSANETCDGGVPCINIEECPFLSSPMKANGNLFVFELSKRLKCGYDKSLIKVCCPPDTARATLTQKAIIQKTNHLNLLPTKQVCGRQNIDRIVGGTITDLDEHPWMALLGYQKSRGSGFYCGGVLISSRYVLTAAHCIKGKDLPSDWKLFQVRLGEWNTTSSNDCLKGECSPMVQDVPIEEIIAHESYDPSDANQWNDIALLRLSRDISFTDFVKPICLPTSANLSQNSFDENDAEVAGWGKTETRAASDVKLKVVVPVVKKSECEKRYEQANRVISNKQICAGSIEGQDSCRGDSGGPLMIDVPQENWIVIGVVSYGPTPCGSPGWPGVYTRVTSYVDWIISKIRP